MNGNYKIVGIMINVLSKGNFLSIPAPFNLKVVDDEIIFTKKEDGAPILNPTLILRDKLVGKSKIKEEIKRDGDWVIRYVANRNIKSKKKFLCFCTRFNIGVITLISDTEE